MNKAIVKYCAGILLTTGIGIPHAQIPINKNEAGITINVYDTVAYFTENRAAMAVVSPTLSGRIILQ